MRVPALAPIFIPPMAALMAALMAAAAPPPAPPPAPVAPPPASAAPVLTLVTPMSLFNGKDFAGWTWHPSVAGTKVEDVWTIKDGNLHSILKGKSTGFLATDKQFKDFVLTVEYRHMSPDNGGIYVCIAGEEKVWPNALQIQAKFGAVGDLINQNTGMKKVVTDPARTRTVNRDVVIARMAPAAPALAEKPLTEWNTLVITLENGSLTVTNNGVLLNSAKELDPAVGKIGIQAEGAAMEFRKIDVAPVFPKR